MKSHAEIAAEEVEKALIEYPWAAGAIGASTRLLSPGMLKASKDEKPYRSHCRELLERMSTKKDLQPATQAEVLFWVLALLAEKKPTGDKRTLAFIFAVSAVLYQRVYGEVLPTLSPESRELVARVKEEAIDDYVHQVSLATASPWRFHIE